MTAQSQKVFVPAGFWVRALALLVDSIVLSLFMQVVAFIRHSQDETIDYLSYDGLAYAIYFVVLGVYSGAFYATQGATLGKRAFGLEVVDNQNGNRISFWRGFFREVIGKNVSLLSLGIGYIWAAFNKDKRTLHDFIFDTRVVKRTELVHFSSETPAELPLEP